MKLTVAQKMEVMLTGIIFFILAHPLGAWLAGVITILAMAVSYFHFKRGYKLSEDGEKLIKKIERIIWIIVALFAFLALAAFANWYLRYGHK